MNKKLIFLEMNEINFDFVKLYLERTQINSLRNIVNGSYIETCSETKYDLLEPWIQWVSIHTGKSAEEHKIYRLGDCTNSEVAQIYEIIESRGYKVGAISPMNTDNRLKKPTFFIPDPWTETNSDGSFWSKIIGSTISKIVNTNANNNINILDMLKLTIVLIRFAKIKNYFSYVFYALTSIRRKWRKALFLDLLLSDIYLSLLKRYKPDFSTLFLNSCAHIQHHYLNNSKMNNDLDLINPEWLINKKDDPFKEVLIVYDKIISDLMKIENYELLIATGLTQIQNQSHDYYYRLRDHTKFIKKFDISFSNIIPLMSRDFIINFEEASQTLRAIDILKSIKVNNVDPLFGEIDNRGKSIFLSLVYNEEIKEDTFVNYKEDSFKILSDVAFVALKNGKHSGKGFLYFTGNSKNFDIKGDNNIKNIFNELLDYYPESKV